MKTIKLFLLLTALFFANQNISFSQWIDKGEFKELSAKFNQIVTFQAPKNNKTFFVLDSFINIYQYNYDGNLIYQRNVPQKVDNADFFKLSKDCESLIYIKSTDINKYQSILDIRIYDIFSNKLIKNIIDTFYISIYSSQFYVDYSTKNDIFLFYLNHEHHPRYNSNYMDSFQNGGGRLIVKDTTFYLSGGYITTLSYDEDISRLFVSGSDEKLWSDGGMPIPMRIEWNNLLYQFFDYKSKKSNSYQIEFQDNHNILLNNLIINSCIANNSNNMIGISQNSFFESEFKDGKLLEKSSLFSFKVLKEIIYSKFDNYLYAINLDNTISIYSFYNHKKIKTFDLVDKTPILDLKISSDNNGFFVRTNNTIRHYDIRSITDVENTPSNTEKTLISPNPACDYITISLDSPSIKRGLGGVSFEIYNIFGEVTTLSNPSLTLPVGEGTRKIDISNLAPGVYFVRIGDRFEKFVKY
jgi:hypothetical protein